MMRKSVQKLASEFLRSARQGRSQDVKRFSTLPPGEQRLAGQVAMITGGASGLGAATARLFTQNGARVVIADIQPPSEQLLKELGSQGEFVECDVRKEGDIENAVNKAFSLENRLDILHSNAGIIGCVGPLDELSIEEYDATIAVDLRASVIALKHAVRVMKPRKKGSVIFTGSVAGVQGGMGPHGYSVAKAGLIGLMRSAAAELGCHGIRINMVSPELVATPLAAYALAALGEGGTHSVTVGDIDNIVFAGAKIRGRLLRDVDVANAALFLASDMGGYVSGHNLIIDGGMTAVQVLNSAGNTWYTKYMPMVAENGRRGL